MVEQIKEQFDRMQAETPDLYQFLNNFRNWVNAVVVNYEIFLEDNWFDDKTTIEYTFRSLDTFNIVVFAEDEYENHRDEKGVWHLGKYIKTYWTVVDPWQEIAHFIAENGSPRYLE